MSVIYNTKILLKTGYGYPGTVLDVGEAGYDLITNKLWIGNGVGSVPEGITMDPSYNSLSAIVAGLDASMGNYTTYNYVDGSLSIRDIAITNLNIDKANKIYVDGSLNKIDISINNLYNIKADKSTLTSYVTKLYVDGSLSKRDVSILDIYNKLALKSDLTYVNTKFNSIDSSITLIKSSKSDLSYVNTQLGIRDASISLIKTLNTIQDVSISALKSYNTIQDASIIIAKTLNTIQDVSISALKSYNTIQDVSINEKVKKSGDTMTGNLTVDASVIVNGTLKSNKYVLGSDLIVYPIANHQSAIKTLWGLQLDGLSKSGLNTTPSGIGTNGDYNVLVYTDSTNANPNISSFSIIGGSTQTSNLQVWQNSSLSTLAYVNNIGKAKFVGMDSTGDVSISKNIIVDGSILMFNNMPAITGDILYNTPAPAALPTTSTTYTNIFVYGTGGPDLSNLTNWVINWSLSGNALNSFNFSTNDGNPGWWVNLLTNSTQTFNQVNPAVTFTGIGITNFNGAYWVNKIGSDIALVSKTGNFSIYLSTTSSTYTPIVYDQTLVGIGSDKKLYNTNVKASVYGTEFQLVEDTTSTTTSSTSAQTKLSMTTTSLPTGKYKIMAKWRFSHSSDSSSARFDVTVNGTSIGTNTPMSVEPKDTTNISSLVAVEYIVLTGINTINLRYWNEGNNTTISDAAIELIRVS